MSESAVLDPSVLDALRQLTPPGEPDVLHDVLRMFLQEVPARMERLRNAMAAGNIEEVHRSAHSLKGSAGNIGAHALYSAFKALDEKSKSGNLDGAEALVEELRIEFGRVEAAIHRLIGSGG
ncbi:MAG TPA: Hpt domain-containing protein [Vicinamibacterales bacterium]|nr:Hpt domain-containing protein [Vicinamibacterales bacterium]